MFWHKHLKKEETHPKIADSNLELVERITSCN